MSKNGKRKRKAYKQKFSACADEPPRDGNLHFVKERDLSRAMEKLEAAGCEVQGDRIPSKIEKFFLILFKKCCC